MSNSKNREGFRFCIKCKIEHPLNLEYFNIERSRYKGFSYLCKCCQSIVSKLKPKRPERWRNSTPEQKKSKSIAMMKYYNKTKISVHRVRSYKQMDKKRGLIFDLSLKWYEENIHDKPCHYCFDNLTAVGCDRIDNKQGHTKENVVPCCIDCNRTRMDNYSYEEMIILGETIRLIKEHRNKTISLNKEFINAT